MEQVTVFSGGLVKYELAKTGGSPWTRLTLHYKNPDRDETFEIGEPVQFMPNLNVWHNQSDDAVWWIESFKQWRQSLLITATSRRNGGERCEFPLVVLRKLPAMLRIAIEASR
jgi:hypothetical protein